MTAAASRRSPLTALAGLALALAAVFAGAAAPAAAHDQLVASDPAAGATVDALPGELVLTFSAELLGAGGGNELRVTDAAGTVLSEEPAVVDGTMLRQTLTGDASGAVTVLWRAVSSDGHPISGEYSFTVAAAAEPSTEPSSEPTMTTMAPADPSPAPTAAEPEATPVAAGDDTAEVNPLPWIAVGVVLLAALAGVLMIVLRARGGAAGDGSATGDDR